MAGVTTWVVLFFVVFRTGTFVASGDIAPMVVDGLRVELGWQWTHQTSGAGGPTYEIVRSVEVAAAMLGRAIGGTEALGQRLLYAAIWASAAAACAALAHRCTRRTWVAAILGVAAVMNPFTLIAHPNPLPILTIAIVAGAVVVTIDAAVGRPRRLALAMLTAPCSYVALNPPLLAVIAVSVAATPFLAPIVAGAGRRGARRVLTVLLGAAPAAVLLSLWWTVPMVIAISRADASTTGVVTDVDAWSWTHSRSSLLNVAGLVGHWSWPRPEYYGIARTIDGFPWMPLRFVLPVLAVGAPLVVARSRRLAAALMSALIIATVFVGKGLHAPFAGVNRWMYQHVPGFWLLREPVAKVGVLLVVLYTMAVAMTIDAVLDRIGPGTPSAASDIGPRRRRLVVAGILALPVIGAWPLWTGAMLGPRADGRPGDRVALPASWRQVAAVINASARDGKALVLPVNDYYQLPTTWGYYGADNLVRRLLSRPVLLSDPQLYVGDSEAFEALMHSTEQTLAVDGGQGSTELLRALGVSHVVVRKDVDLDSAVRRPAMRRFEPILAGLARVPGITRILTTEVADVFEVRGARVGPVEVRSGIVTVGRLDPTRLALLRSTLGERIAVASGTRMLALRVGSAVVRHADEAAALFDAGDGGTWTVSRRGASEPAVRVRVLPGVLESEELVHWRVGAGGLPNARRIVPVPGLVAAEVAGETVDVDGEAVVVRVDAAVSAVPWVEVPKGARLGSRSGVLDCNNRGPASPAALGHRAGEVLDGGDAWVELRAARHAACVRWEVTGAKPGDTLRLRVVGRSLRGGSPRTCLWMAGPNRCAPLEVRVDADQRAIETRQLWTVPPGVTGLTLYVYADEPAQRAAGPGTVPGDARAETVTRYRVPEVTTVRAESPVAIRTAPPTRAQVEVRPGRQIVEATTSIDLPSVGAVGQLSDCNRFDDRTPAQAGLSREIVGDVIRLAARSHSACVRIPLHGAIPSVRYRLSFEHRTARGIAARACVLDVSAGSCLWAARLEGSGKDWRTESISFEAPSALAGRLPSLALYLYADGHHRGPSTVTEYRAVSIRPSVDEYLALVKADTSVAAPPGLTYRRLSPARYRVRITDARGPFVLALSDAWSEDWRVTGLPDHAWVDHVRIDGYRNGWAIDATGDLELLVEYVPARAGQVAIRISAATAALIALGLGSRRFGRSRRPRHARRAPRG